MVDLMGFDNNMGFRQGLEEVGSEMPKHMVISPFLPAHISSMGDLQDPKMEVRQYHISGHILLGYSLT
jgi:hypothetical protein